MLKCMVKGCDDIGTVEDAIGQKMCVKHFQELQKERTTND